VCGEARLTKAGALSSEIMISSLGVARGHSQMEGDSPPSTLPFTSHRTTCTPRTQQDQRLTGLTGAGPALMQTVAS
jgi:hypothetical protein